MQPLQGKVALVTGSARGIGAEIALTLAKAGAKVIVNYAQNQAAADRVCAAITEAGGECLAVQADVSDPAAVRQLFTAAIERFQQIDILVNNVGVLVFKEIAEISDDEFDRIVDINFKSVFYTLREAAAKLADHGRIVTVSSTVTRLMLPKYGAYAATKAAVEQLTRIFAREAGKRGITANIVSPGPVDTELFRSGKTPADIERMAAMAALGRLGATDDIAQVVLFLVSDEARWITGQNIGVNGGII
ncbi:SDR family oxidoreductase [Nitrosomonas oligotropha]|uniref:3-oxoacyl-[acyl-carrier protein] reductase n=1 Tax=Nitrosomonas oligotropha TaxID=42354 RepID=A0A1H8MA43_9PROT|nr:SDR family oxidoreductase [Nitrosomonas oligotropha]SDW48476.1 3-oxoacyl-[acyl-carrier protein] reductase [Nitrosomonas oligotropha]SEO14199.1 3-oxoacyl-[acyl-carrier protein] reductase [Nitrosomonas oligotropha]